MAYQPLTVLGDENGDYSFIKLLRDNPPQGKDFTNTSTERLVRWAENDPVWQTYFKPSIKNLPAYNAEGTRNKFHNPNESVGTMLPNPAYVTDYPEYKASLDPEHLKYLGHNVEQMASDMGSFIAGGFGWMEDPDGMAKFRTNALERMADQTKWGPITQFWSKSLAKLSAGIELDKNTPEYREAKKQAKEWYGISQAYLKTGDTMAFERMANSVSLRGYFRWMEDQPMAVDNFLHAEQFKRSMAEMAPSVAALLAATAVTGGGALIGGAVMFALEGSGEWSEAMHILTVEGIPKRDEKGNIIMEPQFITAEIEGKSQQIRNPKYGQPVRETMSFEQAAPIAGQAALIYGAISAPMETFQIGRATRLLKIAPQARKSFLLKMFDKAIIKQPLLTKTGLYAVDFSAEAIEGGAIEWLQTVTQMSINKAIEKGYGNNPKEALEALAHELGPMEMTKFMFSEEGGMSDDAKTAFLLGLSGEAGMGAIGGPGRMAYTRFMEGKGQIPTFFDQQPITRPDIIVTPEGVATKVPTAAEIVTEATTISGFDPLTLVRSPDKAGSALGYAAMLVSQVTENTPYADTGVNNIIATVGGAGDKEINDLINRDTRRGTEERPDRKAFNLLNALENEPEIRKQVLDVINSSPVLKEGIVLIDKDIVKNKLPSEDQGTATTTTQSEDIIDEINTDEWIENWDNVEELANAELEKKGQAKLQEKAEKKYEEGVDDDIPPVGEDAEDLAMGKTMGLKGTDAQILTQYRKELAKTDEAPKKKAKKIAPTKNINEESAPLQHLKDIQLQSGDAGVRAILKGNKKKKIPQASLTTLNVLQNELFPEEDRILPVNTQNRGAIVEKVAHKIFSTAPAAPQVAPHKRKAPIKKKAVKAITKKKPITIEKPTVQKPGKLKKIISGAQIGVDQLGLQAAKEGGYETGGTAPPGWATSTGPQQALMEDYGLTEGEADPKTYPKRTRKNVEDADGTVLFGEMDSPGSKLTLGHAKKIGKPYITNPTAQELNQWIVDNDIETLNIAGNRKIDESKVTPVLREALGIEAPIEAPVTTPAKPDKEDIAMAKSMGISVADYMKTIAVSEEKATVKKKAPKLDVEFGSAQGEGFSLVSELMEEETESRIKGKTVVDLGSGQTYSKYKDQMKTAGAKEVVGVDPNFKVDYQQDMLSFLHSQANNSLDIVTMNAIEFHPTSVVIKGKEALKYQEAVFKEIERVIKPGGSLIGSSTTDFLDIPGWNKIEEGTTVIYDKPSKKKTKEPLAAEKADKLIDDIIGVPKVNAKTKRKLDSIQKESKTKADESISKSEEIDSITDEMNDKLDEDLCI